MSGRAGRRGFDPIGNVVFFGIPYRKVQRLITANIPWLIGNFPINVSLVLRLLLMTSKGDDEEDALTKVSVNLTKRYDIKYLQVQSFHLFNPFRIAICLRYWWYFFKTFYNILQSTSVSLKSEPYWSNYVERKRNHFKPQAVYSLYRIHFSLRAAYDNLNRN